MPPTHPYKSNKNKVVSTHNKQISQQSVSYYYISSFYVNISHYIQEKETMLDQKYVITTVLKLYD